MEQIIEHIVAYRYFYFIGFLALILVILLIALKPKKVKPIEITIDDEKTEKTDIERVMEALESKAASRPMTTFEEEQEANAIISYRELVEAVNAKKAQINLEQKDDTKTTVLDIATKLENNKIEEVPALEVSTEAIEEEKKFKNSEFISPIFGKDSNKTNEEFLNNLKDFRSSL